MKHHLVAIGAAARKLICYLTVGMFNKYLILKFICEVQNARCNYKLKSIIRLMQTHI